MYIIRSTVGLTRNKRLVFVKNEDKGMWVFRAKRDFYSESERLVVFATREDAAEFIDRQSSWLAFHRPQIRTKKDERDW